MRRFARSICVSALLAALATPALAAPYLVNGEFTGGEEEQFNIPQTCTAQPLWHQQFGPFTVSVTGNYQFNDIGWYWGLDAEFAVLDAPVDPSDPLADLVSVFDEASEVALHTGTDYYLVAQPRCFNETGVWGVSVAGPGNVSGGGVIPVPEWGYGSFEGDEPLANLSGDDSCPDSYYEVSAPLRLDEPRDYFMYAPGHQLGQSIDVYLYAGSFDAAQPQQNQVAAGTDNALFRLEADVDYRFVVQPNCELRTQDWMFVLFPRKPFRINPGMAAAYYDPATSGQGVLMSLFPEARVLFMAWFTFDTMPPVAQETREIGQPGSTWLVGQGTWEPDAASMQLDLFSRGGGLFNDPTSPAGPNQPAGTATLEMESCARGQLHYELLSGLEGTALLERLAATDGAEYCESFFTGPAVIQP